jgi:hypothetical protein
MAVLHGLPEWWVDLDLEFLAGVLHGRRERAARRQIVIVSAWKKKTGTREFRTVRAIKA